MGVLIAPADNLHVPPVCFWAARSGHAGAQGNVIRVGFAVLSVATSLLSDPAKNRPRGFDVVVDVGPAEFFQDGDDRHEETTDRNRVVPLEVESSALSRSRCRRLLDRRLRRPNLSRESSPGSPMPWI